MEDSLEGDLVGFQWGGDCYAGGEWGGLEGGGRGGGQGLFNFAVGKKSCFEIIWKS